MLRYGSARSLVLGLEVVLPDGRVLDLLRSLHKDNTGYDLKQLFIGAEGTLGVITAATLKLYPAPASYETAFVAVRDPQAAVELLDRLQTATGGLVSAFELIPRLGLELVLAHIPDTRDPLAISSPWYVLAEATSAGKVSLRDAFQEIVAEAIEAVSQATPRSRRTNLSGTHLWRLRENISEAQKREGASIKHDISVPVKDIPRFLAEGTALVERHDARCSPGIVRPSRRRQHPLQFQRAERRRRRGLSFAMERRRAGRPRSREQFRRLDQRRTWCSESSSGTISSATRALPKST